MAASASRRTRRSSTRPGDGSNGSHDEPVNLGTLVEVVVTATDNDGDVVEKSINIGNKIVFEDDGPKLVGSAPVAVTVDEDDILNLQSQGTSPYDGTGDGSATEFFSGAAVASGKLAGLVDFGADGAAAGGGFGFTATAETDMAAMGLQSKGVTLSYTIVNGTLIGYVDNGGAGYNPLQDRTVLSLTVKAGSGDFTFRLFDQLDHVAGGDQNTQLATTKGPLDAIDFGSVITATDGDGDFVVLGGKVNVTVTDDIPQIFLKALGGSVTHDETAGNQNDDTGNAAVAARFASLEGPGLTAIGYARDGNVFAYGTVPGARGADEPISLAVALRIVGADGVDLGPDDDRRRQHFALPPRQRAHRRPRRRRRGRHRLCRGRRCQWRRQRRAVPAAAAPDPGRRLERFA